MRYTLTVNSWPIVARYDISLGMDRLLYPTLSSAFAVDADRIIRRVRMLKTLVLVFGALTAVLLSTVQAVEFRTRDPLKAFVYGEYPLGSDYFIMGNEDTFIFRCVLTEAIGPFEGIALSEISIWGNRTGPWEIFRRESNGNFVYVETKLLADTSCFESCPSKEYLASGHCTWRHGWPRP